LALEKDSNQHKSEPIIANKYAERFCNAKENNYFEGLENEMTLKYSYFRYMGFQNEEIYSTDMHNQLVFKIREKCHLTNKEEKEIREFFHEKKVSSRK
tara:strand:+ start:786 stop:1079 length:294 start_codon:yes stop_codon:yes gene_type:complete